MRCFVCNKPAAFKFRWPWGAVELGCCKQHTGEVTRKARANAARPPELEPIMVENHEPPPPTPPKGVPAVVGDELGELERNAPTKDETPTDPGPRRRVAPPPPPQSDGHLAHIELTRSGPIVAFKLTRPGQHDAEGPIGDLGVTLVALGWLTPPREDEPPPTEPPQRLAGGPLTQHSHPGQVTPPSAAAALAGAVSPQRGRPPVNPPAPLGLAAGVGGRGHHPPPFAPPPLGAVGPVSAVPGNPPPTPPPVAPPGAAPVAPDVPPGGGPEPTGHVVE